MSNRGPKTNVSHEMRVIELQKHNIFYEDGKVKKESDPVWVKICANLNKGLDPKEKPISVRNIQTYVSQNRNHVIQDIKKDSANTSNLRPDNEVNNVDFNVEERLLKIKNNALYKPIIRELCTYPFIIFHWSFEALDLVSNFKEGVFIFGVAGSPCQPFIAPDKTVSEKIFLFTLGIDVLNEFISICEFSSEENSVSLVNRFFYECLRSGLKIPKKLTVDYYYNHIISANSVFNVNISLEKYLTLCYKNLINEEAELPKCIITTDVRLLIVKVKKWDCISNIALQSIKKFFIYSIILLSIQRNLLELQNILKKLFVIAYSTYQNEHTDSSINYLMTEIKDKQINLNYNDKYIEDIENQYRDFLNLEIDDSLNYSKCQQITNFITDTFVESRIYHSRQEGIERNAYFNENFCHDLIKLCIRFPLWTNIMSEEVDTKDVSILKIHEQQFKEYLLKECDDSLPTADQYLITRIDYNKTKMTFAKTSINQRLIKKKDVVELDNTYLYYEENWKGLNPDENLSEEGDISDSDADELSDSSISPDDNNDDSLMMENSQNDVTISMIVESFCKTLKEDNDESYDTLKANSMESSYDENMIVDSTHQEDNGSSRAAQSENTVIDTAAAENKQLLSRGKFLRPCPEIELLQQKPIKNNKNQSKRSKMKERKLIQNANLYPPRKVNRQSVIVKTSSHFDCILEILTTVYSLIQTFKEFVYNPTDAIQRIHAEFLSILQSYVSNFNLTSLYNARVKFLTEICNAEDEFSWTKNIGEFYKKIIFPNIFVKFYCPYCNTDSYEHFNTIKLSYKHLSADTINNAISPSVCSQCQHCKNSRVVTNIETNYLLCLDVEDSTEDTLNLNYIKITIDLEKESLILVGVIGFEEPIGRERLRHYVAYSRNFDGSWLKYNSTQLSKRISRLPKNEFDIKVALVIYAKYDLGK